MDAMLPLVTFVLWALCLTVGVLGLWLANLRVREVGPSAPRTPTQVVNVEVVKAEVVERPVAEAPPVAGAAPVAHPVAPAPPPVMSQSPRPEMSEAVASPAAVAFAVPAQDFVKIVTVYDAGSRGGTVSPIRSGSTTSPHSLENNSEVSATSTVSAVTHLTLGEGEGNQPLPEYPPEAQLGGQEGTVVLNFTVDEEGRVTKVSVVSGTRWPLLNQSAMHVVRSRWKFGAGPVRLYEVPIEFSLSK